MTDLTGASAPNRQMPTPAPAPASLMRRALADTTYANPFDEPAVDAPAIDALANTPTAERTLGSATIEELEAVLRIIADQKVRAAAEVAEAAAEAAAAAEGGHGSDAFDTHDSSGGTLGRAVALLGSVAWWSGWRLQVSFFLARLLFALTALPFLLFEVPLLRTLLSHTYPTGYDERGRCVRVLSAMAMSKAPPLDYEWSDVWAACTPSCCRAEPPPPPPELGEEEPGAPPRSGKDLWRTVRLRWRMARHASMQFAKSSPSIRFADTDGSSQDLL